MTSLGIGPADCSVALDHGPLASLGPCIGAALTSRILEAPHRGSPWTRKLPFSSGPSEKVKFLRLQFTDILGVIKNVEVPDRQFEEALDGQIMFDGSSIEGFVRIEESDMYLKPDLDDLPGLPVDRRQRRERVGRHDLRHRQPRRHARSPAARARR